MSEKLPGAPILTALWPTPVPRGLVAKENVLAKAAVPRTSFSAGNPSCSHPWTESCCKNHHDVGNETLQALKCIWCKQDELNKTLYRAH